MPDTSMPKAKGATDQLGFATRLAHDGRPPTDAIGLVNPAVQRGSTVLYPTCEAKVAQGARVFDQVLTYGLEGNSTHHALEDVVAGIEGGTRCQIVSSGLAAVTTALLAFLGAGDHCLVPDSIYWPTRSFCDVMLARMGVATTYYDPELGEAGLRALMRPETRVVFVESPGSHTFEVQDVPALARAAHEGGAKLLIDNTWGIHFFQPFAHGADVSIQALTKYAGGHSDLLLGSITTADDATWRQVRTAAMQLGQYASPDDCWLALRGARTLAIRLQRQMASGLEVASWFAAQPEVARVLHPALPGAPGHALWKRDFTGACSLFGVEFQPRFRLKSVQAMIDSLSLFGIGASWGGFESLALPTTGYIERSAGTGRFHGPAVRWHIGLEDPADLIADLDAGLAVMRAHG
jgi:cystathionine beta-lyase